MNDVAGQRESLECWAQFSPCHPGLCARREWPDLLGLLNVLDIVTSGEIMGSCPLNSCFKTRVITSESSLLMLLF